MSATERHLRLVDADEAAPDPTEPAVWRRGLASARAALDAGHQRPEAPHAGPEAPTPATLRPRLPAIAEAWRVVEDGSGGQR